MFQWLIQIKVVTFRDQIVVMKDDLAVTELIYNIPDKATPFANKNLIAFTSKYPRVTNMLSIGSLCYIALRILVILTRLNYQPRMFHTLTLQLSHYLHTSLWIWSWIKNLSIRAFLFLAFMLTSVTSTCRMIHPHKNSKKQEKATIIQVYLINWKLAEARGK